MDCNFISNTARNNCGAIQWSGANGTLSSSIFTGNTAGVNGGGVYWLGVAGNGKIIESTFNNNAAGDRGGGVFWSGANGILVGSSFTNNTSRRNGGGVYWNARGYMVNCSFNSKWIKSNGICTVSNLTIIGGNGIVDIVTSNLISGISIVVLNNETYYYPPNSNINLIYLQNHEHETAKDNLQNNQ